jgi:hypothetical protein
MDADEAGVAWTPGVWASAWREPAANVVMASKHVRTADMFADIL